MRRLRSAFGAGCTAVGVVLVLLCGCGSRSGHRTFSGPVIAVSAESLHTDMSDTLRFGRLHSGETARLEAGWETTDGSRLAELDLKLRGAGDINGTLQSGMAFDLKIASPTADVQILTVSREAAAEILAADPALAHPQNRGLEALRRRYSGREEIDFSRIS